MGGGGRGGGGAYRRRRVLVVVVVAVTALVGVRLTGAGTDAVAGPVTVSQVVAPAVSTAPAESTAPSVTARPSASRTPAASRSASPPPPKSASPSASAAPSTSGSSWPSSSPAATAGCGSSELQLGALAAVGDANSTLVAGSPVRFTLTVASTATVSCLVRPGLGMTVTSGKDRIWTTGDCPLSPIAEPGLAGPVPTTAPTLAGTAQGVFLPAAVTLAPGAVATLDIVWPGNRSVGSCSAGPATLRPGTYVADVTVDGVGSAHTAFQLS